MESMLPITFIAHWKFRLQEANIKSVTSWELLSYDDINMEEENFCSQVICKLAQASDQGKWLPLLLSSLNAELASYTIVSILIILFTRDMGLAVVDFDGLGVEWWGHSPGSLRMHTVW